MPPRKSRKKPNPKIKKGTRVQNSRLDEAHHPFKRATRLGPAIRAGQRDLRERWECEWIAPYRQKCTWVGKAGDKPLSKRKTKIIKVKPDWKKEYNKEYWKYLKKGAGPKFKNQERGGYANKGASPDWLASRKKAAPKKRLPSRGKGRRTKR